MSYDPGRVDVPELLRCLRLDAEHNGDKWWASCPNPKQVHRDSDASWSINDLPGDEDKNALHHCFGCHWGGTAVTLVADILDISNVSAVDWLKERAMGRAVARLHVELQVQPLRRRFALPFGVHLGPLATWVGPARRYAEERGITAAQVDRWGLGWAAEGTLNGRIVLPARDAAGNVVAYAARTFVGAPKRYLTPRREEGADPAAVFGEHLWPQPGLRRALVLTEGGINALAADRAAPPTASVGALSGSAVSLSQVLKVSTFDRVVLLTDPDPAGDAAAAYLTGALGRHAEVRRVRLPRGEDAQSVGDEELRQWIEHGLR